MSAIKSLIILVQLLLLAVAGWLTRPDEADFRQYLHRHTASQADDFFSRTAAGARADRVMSQCTFRDRWLWVQVEKDGKVAYVGVLAHWFDRTAVERMEMSKPVVGS